MLLLFFRFNSLLQYMMINTKRFLLGSLIFTGISLTSCGGGDKKDKTADDKDSTKKEIKKEETKAPDTKVQRPPIVNIVDTLEPKRTVAYSKDSAASFDRIKLKLENIYGVKMQEYIKKNNLKAVGAPMAWYTKQKAPFFFEAGFPVNKAGSKAVTGVQIREIAAGKAVIAHFFGPFDLLPLGYDAIKEFIKDNKKTAAGAPYEVYLTDPIGKDGKPVDPYKIQTDIVFPIK
jgi:effector-binding domain-containing protein